ncbi:hypothetical protein DNTS_008879 [Danionella cerebrum]|uniref:Glycosyltransferase 2-like domain-containing protein n=1 Tax=Danionella cerebrum TaxID=2873325 RepID=A0A553MVV0_9TELE|nr:hypothetical protein DNTS_008879 [Danionella translucida]
MRRFVYCKVVLTTSLVWVLVDVFLLLYFSECNKCDQKQEHSLLPALREKVQVDSQTIESGGIPNGAKTLQERVYAANIRFKKMLRLRWRTLRRFAHQLLISHSLIPASSDPCPRFISAPSKQDLLIRVALKNKVEAVISRSHEAPGEMGKAVAIPKEEQEKMKELFKINQFNLMASDMIALNRTLPDVRLDGCKTKTYPDDLPNTSIVIVFHNEAWSTLLRTVHSAINRSPRHLLLEILLVDDASERGLP